MSDKAQRTEKPTPRKLREAAREGRVARSGDVTAWLTVFSGTMLVPHTVRAMRELFDRLLVEVGAVVADPDPARALGVFRAGGLGMLRVLAPVLLASIGVTVVGGALQGGLRMSSHRLRPKFEKLNVAKGLRHLVSAQAGWTLAKTLLKFAAFAVLAWVVLAGVTGRFSGGTAWSVSSLAGSAGDSAVRLFRAAAAVGLAVAVADYAVERRQLATSLMMTREEVKREMRQSEGDPLQKGALRARQRELSRNRMMADIARADVVVVNPVHVAVALAYQPGSGAPRVVAKGAGAIAARIREEAEKHRLPMVEDVPLARTLYRVCDLGQEIPPELYGAVAQVLAFVMALRRRGGSVAGLHRPAGSPRPVGTPCPAGGH